MGSSMFFNSGEPELRHLHAQLVAHLAIHGIGQADAAADGQRFDARGDVHAVAIHVRLAMHHVADVDANPHMMWRSDGLSGVAGDNGALDFHRALASPGARWETRPGTRHRWS